MNYYKYPRSRNHHQGNRFYNQTHEVNYPVQAKEQQTKNEMPTSTKVLLKIAAKKVFRLKTIPILFNYFMRKSGLAGATKRLEEETVKAASTFFES